MVTKIILNVPNYYHVEYDEVDGKIHGNLTFKSKDYAVVATFVNNNQHGVRYVYNKSNKLIEKTTFVNGKRHGRRVIYRDIHKHPRQAMLRYNEDVEYAIILNYNNGVLDGDQIEQVYIDGKWDVTFYGFYKNGSREGVFYYNYPNSSNHHFQYFKNDLLIHDTNYTDGANYAYSCYYKYSKVYSYDKYGQRKYKNIDNNYLNFQGDAITVTIKNYKSVITPSSTVKKKQKINIVKDEVVYYDITPYYENPYYIFDSYDYDDRLDIAKDYKKFLMKHYHHDHW